MLVLPVVGLVIALLAIAFAELTDKGVDQVLFSGQGALPGLVANASSWSTGALGPAPPGQGPGLGRVARQLPRWTHVPGAVPGRGGRGPRRPPARLRGQPRCGGRHGRHGGGGAEAAAVRRRAGDAAHHHGRGRPPTPDHPRGRGGLRRNPAPRAVRGGRSPRTRGVPRTRRTPRTRRDRPRARPSPRSPRPRRVRERVAGTGACRRVVSQAAAR